MSGKHTSGPWDVELLGCVWKGGVMHPPNVDEARKPGESWLDMRARTQPARDAREAEIAANARLRAAAPEMLDALKALVEECEEYELGNPDVLRAARAAIRKAEGEP